MRLSLTQSGGLAGLRRPPIRLDLERIDARRAARVRELVARAKFFDLPMELAERAPNPDAFQYTLEVEPDDGRAHRVTFSDANASDALRELRRELLR